MGGMARVYTVGHSTRGLAELVALLQARALHARGHQVRHIITLAHADAEISTRLRDPVARTAARPPGR